MNALVDPAIIRELYEASQAGVTIDLIVRGICCLRPGIPEVSDRIHVVSIIGRFLEHSRAFYFQNGGAEEVYIGSADWMPRNLDRRIESVFPVTDPTHRQTIRDLLNLMWRKAITASAALRALTPSLPPIGSWSRVTGRAVERLGSIRRCLA
jgi:polyphosphate kinase